MEIRVKRVFEEPGPEDGVRILVDGLWPRGVSKTGAAVDHWARDVAPSAELRKWFGHVPSRWAEFRRRYFTELDTRGSEVEKLRDICKGKKVTFVFAARNPEQNNAVALRDYLLIRHSAR